MYGAVNLPATQVPVILNSHNVEHFILQRYVALEPNPAKRLYERLGFRISHDDERKFYMRREFDEACRVL